VHFFSEDRYVCCYVVVPIYERVRELRMVMREGEAIDHRMNDVKKCEPLHYLCYHSSLYYSLSSSSYLLFDDALAFTFHHLSLRTYASLYASGGRSESVCSASVEPVYVKSMPTELASH
jgi:hypothetical protein